MADLNRLHWHGHASFRLDGPPVIYFDPYQLPDGLPAADLVLISHEHFDHCSPADVARVATPQTLVIGPADCTGKFAGAGRTVGPGETFEIAGVTVRTIPAYNVDKQHHPRRNGWVGYLVTVGDTTWYHAGDTDLIEEMTALAPDVAMLPVSGTYVMNADEAIIAARRLEARTVVPMHFGSVVGTRADAERLAEALHPGIQVVIPGSTHG